MRPADDRVCVSLPALLKATANGQALLSGWGWGAVARRGVPALLIPGVVPFDEAFCALQLRMQAVLLAPVPGHALGGYAETEQNDGVQG